MSRLFSVLLIGLVATSANAAVMGLHGGDPFGPLHGPSQPLLLLLSETANIYLTLDLYHYIYYCGTVPYTYVDTPVGEARVFMDTIHIAPPGDIYAESLDILGVLGPDDPGFLWTDYRDFSGEMAPYESGDLAPGDPAAIDFEGYALLAGSAEGLHAPDSGALDFDRYVLDVITIHNTVPWDLGGDKLYFESPYTMQPPDLPGGARPPALVHYGSTDEYPIASGANPDLRTPGQLAMFGWLGFENGYLDKSGSELFWYETEPFVIGIPEPGSLGLLAVGTLALLRRKV